LIYKVILDKFKQKIHKFYSIKLLLHLLKKILIWFWI